MNTSKCPSCGNESKGDFVYKCSHCNHIYCEDCAKEGSVDTYCPECSSTFGEFLYEIS